MAAGAVLVGIAAAPIPSPMPLRSCQFKLECSPASQQPLVYQLMKAFSTIVGSMVVEQVEHLAGRALYRGHVLWYWFYSWWRYRKQPRQQHSLQHLVRLILRLEMLFVHNNGEPPTPKRLHAFKKKYSQLAVVKKKLTHSASEPTP